MAERRHTARQPAEAGINTSVGSVGDSCGNASRASIIGLFKTEVVDNRTPNEAEDAFNQQQNELAEAAQLLDKNSLEEPRQSKFKIKTTLALCKKSSNLSLSLCSKVQDSLSGYAPNSSRHSAPGNARNSFRTFASKDIAGWHTYPSCIHLHPSGERALP